MKQKKTVLYLLLPLLAIVICLCSTPKAMAKEVEYNVKNEGVKGDGVTIDTKAINQVLEKATELEEGDTLVVYFPEGTYMIDNLMRIYSNTTLKLDENAEIYRTDTTYPMLMNVGDDGTRKETSVDGGGYNLSKNIQIIGGTFNGGDISKAKAPSNTINIAHAQNVVFDNVIIKNNYGAHLLELSGVKDAIIRNCDFSGFRPEKTSKKSQEEKGLNGTGYAPKECIQLDYTYFDPSDVSMQWCPDYYSDKTPCQNVLIENNTFHDYPRGVGNHHGCEEFPGLYSSNITIKDNTFTNMYVKAPNGKDLYEYVILLHSFENAVVENNTITNAGSAVLFAYDKNSVVNNNTITNLTSTAFVVSKDSTGSKITWNTVTDCPRYGISVSGGVTVSAFNDNTLKKGSKSKKMLNGITINGEEGKATISKVERNTISDCTQYGISTLAVKKINSITGNTFSKCEKAGMCISGTTCTTIKDNTVNGVKNTNSIMIIKGSNIKKLQNNTLLKNGKHGISIGSASKVDLISGNTIKTSVNNGICVFENSKVDKIEKNKITESKIGVSILNSTCNKVNSNTIKKSENYGICATTATVNYVQKNTIDTTKKAGVLFCKNSKGKKISGNTFKNVKTIDSIID